MKKILYILITFALVLSSCTRDSFLDIEPKGVFVPSTIEDYRLLLDQVEGAQGQLVSLSVGFGATHNTTAFVTDDQTLTQEIVNFSGFERNLVQAYTFQENFYTQQEEDTDWSLYYNQIYVANLILEGLEINTDASEEQINELKAEARLHRAYAYFNLVNIYSVHYNATTAATDLGVPLRKDSKLRNLDLTRASVQETYEFILEDITESIDDLKDIQSQNLAFRPSKAGAEGLLARIYLYMGKYDLALTAANNALNFKESLRDINTDRRDTDVSDLILQPNIANNVEVIWAKNYSYIYPLYVADELLESYESNDARRFWYTDNSEVTGLLDVFIFGSQVNSEGSATVGILTSDLYLIAAECSARLDDVDEVNFNLDLLREKRFDTGTYTPLALADKDEALVFVKEERRREMVNSMQRLFDIKRYNRFDNDNISLNHTIGNLSRTLVPNSLNWAYPIAQKYIQLNPEIKQNPRD